MAIQTTAIDQYFPVVLFIMLYKVLLTFESVDEILKCNHSNESYRPVLSCGAVCYAVQGGSIVLACKQYFPVALFLLNDTWWP